MLATRSVGWRSNTPSTTMLPIVSWMGRSDTTSFESTSTPPRNGSNQSRAPHAPANIS